MSDPDQTSERSEPLRKRSTSWSEDRVRMITSCKRAAERYNADFQDGLSWQSVFFYAFLGDCPEICQKKVEFVKDSRVFEGIGQIFKVVLSLSAFKYVESLTDQEMAIDFLVDMGKGKFFIHKKTEKCLVVYSEMTCSLGLIGVVVVEERDDFGFEFKVFVECGWSGSDSGFDMELEKFCCERRKIVKFEDIQFESDVITFEDRKYYPGIIKGWRTSGRAQEFQSNDSNQALKYLKNENTGMELRTCKGNELVNQLDIDINNFKEKFMQNCEKYRKSTERDTRDLKSFKNLFIEWHQKELSGRKSEVDIYEGFGAIWRIKIDLEILKTLQALNEDQFLLYLKEFIKFSQGFIIQDPELFYRLNEKSNDDLIFSMLTIKGSSLKSVLAAIYIDYDASIKFYHTIKFAYFCDASDIEEKIKVLRKNHFHKSINNIFGRQGLKSLLFIERNLRLIPTFDLNAPIKERKSKKVHLLYLNIKNQDIFMKNKKIVMKDRIQKLLFFSKNELYVNNQGQRVYILKREYDILENSEYYLQMNWNSDTRNHQFIEKFKKKRKLENNSSSEFLFNIEFVQSEQENKVEVPGKAISDKFEQLFYYMLAIKTEEEIEDLLKSFLSLTEKEETTEAELKYYQEEIVNFIDKKIENNLEKDYQKTFNQLCVLSVVTIYPFDCKLSESSIIKLVFSIKECSGQHLVYFRSKTHFDQAIIGLVKTFIQYEQTSGEFAQLFDTFEDYNYLRSALKTYVKLHHHKGLEIKLDTLKCILSYCKLFTRKQTEGFVRFLFGYIKNPVIKSSLIPETVFILQLADERQEFINSSLKDFKPQLKDLAKILKIIEKKNIVNEFSESVEFRNLIQEFLEDQSLFNQSNLPEMKKIFRFIIKNSKILKIDLIVQIEKLFINSAFCESVDLFYLFSEERAEVFKKWVDQKPSSAIDIQFLEKIDKVIARAPEENQFDISMSVISKIEKSKLFKMMPCVENCSSNVLKESFKSIFTSKLLNQGNHKTTLLDLISLSEKYKECSLFQDLLIEAKNLFRPSEDELIEHILKNPSRSSFLFIFIHGGYFRLYPELFSGLSNCLKSFRNQLKLKTLDFSTFAAIQNHSKSESMAFEDYLRTVFPNSKKRRKLFRVFNELEEKITEINKFCKFMKKIVFKSTSENPELVKKVQTFESFLFKCSSISVGDLKLPAELQGLYQLFVEISVPMTSKLFISLMKEISPFYKGNYEELLRKSLERYKEFGRFMNKIFSCSSLTIDSLIRAFYYIPDEVTLKKESNILNKYLSESNSKKSRRIERNFLETFKMILDFSKVQTLIVSIEACYKILGFLSNPLKKYKNLNQMIFTSETMFLLVTLSNEGINRLTTENIEAVNIFFTVVSENHFIIRLARSIKANFLAFWEEHAINSKYQEISTEIIRKFINVCAFFKNLPNVPENLKDYCDKVINLMNSNKFSTIIEDILECRPCSTLLKDWIRFDNNLDLLNIFVIKKICMESKLSIRRIGGKFEVQLIFTIDEDKLSDIIDLKLIKRLRDKALVYSYSSNLKYQELFEEELSEIFKSFLDFADIICDFIKIIKKLNKTLFRNKLKSQYQFYFKNKSCERLKIKLLKLMNLLNNEWTPSLREIKEKYYNINFLTSENILQVDEFIFDQNHENLIEILPLLNYMQIEIPEIKKEKINPPDSMKERLKYIAKFLEDLKYQPKEFRFSSDHIEKKVNLTPGSILVANTEVIYAGILTIYSIYSTILPRDDIVFFCHRTSKWKKIKSFLFRSLLNYRQEIFSLIKPENLCLKYQNKILELLKRNYDHEKHGLYLAIVTNDQTCFLVSELKMLLFKILRIHSYNILKDQQIKKMVQEACPRIEIVRSTYPGLGKSTYITELGIKEGKKIYDIQITGALEEVNEIIKKYIHIPKSIIKFSINKLPAPQFINELIFKLAIFPSFGFANSIYRLHESSNVVYELGYHKNDNFSEVEMFKYIKCVQIPEFDIKNIKLYPEINYVCRSLIALTNLSIEKTDIDPNVTNDSQGSIIGSYMYVIKKYLMSESTEVKNFHKLNALIRVFFTLLQNLNQSVFSAYALEQYRKHNRADINTFSGLRSFIIQILCNTTKKLMINQSNQLEIQTNNIREYKCVDELTILISKSGYLCGLLPSSNLNQEKIERFKICQKTLKNLKPTKNQENLIEWVERGENSNTVEFDNNHSESLTVELLNLYSRQTLIFDNLKEDSEFIKKRLEKVTATDYVVTFDNFMKMNIIMSRCVSNIPVILDGEPGCGKTSLLKFLIEQVLHERLIIIHLHPGVSRDSMNNQLKLANTEAKTTKDLRYWVLFDNFNRSDFLTDIVVLICERKSIFKLSPKLVLIGSYSQYNVKSLRYHRDDIQVNNNNTVHLNNTNKDIPDKATEFILKFEAITGENLKHYVRSFLQRKNLENIQMFTELICMAHIFLQDRETVGMRDIHRFTSLYQWFKLSIPLRKKYKLITPIKEYHKNKSKLKQHKSLKSIFPGVLSFFHCYALRIPDRDSRDSFKKVAFSVFQQFEDSLSQEVIESLVRHEQLDLASRMTLPEGVAWTDSLIENVFAVVPCIFSKVPVVLCGEPGCGKSLALEIVALSFKGIKSNDKYFKTLPELMVFYYQGLSQEIQEVFISAEESQREFKEILSVVLFEEINLLEDESGKLSILNSLLEYENLKVAFVALSVERLSPLYENKVLCSVRLEFDYKELMNQAKDFFKLYVEDVDLEKYEEYIFYLIRGYLSIKQWISQQQHPELLGLYDFYRIIQYFSRELKNLHIVDARALLQRAIIKNFPPLPFNIISSFFEEIFAGHHQRLRVLDLLVDDLQNMKSRTLMVICSQNVSMYFRSVVLEHYFNNYYFILGSSFEKDRNDDVKNTAILNDIVRCVEEGVPIVLQNLDNIYRSLVNLINDDFLVRDKIKKWNINLGSSNRICFVHENFKAIVMQENDKKLLQATSKSFLQRFEKHHILLKDLLDPGVISMTHDIISWVDEIFQLKDTPNNITPVSSIPIFSEDFITLFIDQKKSESPEVILSKCKKLILKNSSSDLVLLIKLNSMSQDEKKKIENDWKIYNSIDFREYLKKLFSSEKYGREEKRCKLICSTFDCFGVEILKSQFKSLIQFEYCRDFQSEDQLKMSYHRYLADITRKLYLFEIDYEEDEKHLRFVVNVLDSTQGGCKNVCIILRMKRSQSLRKPVMSFKGWKYRMFESLSCNNLNFINEIVDSDLVNIIKSLKILTSEKFKELIQKSFDMISFNSSLHSSEYLRNFKSLLIKHFCETSDMKEIFETLFIQNIQTSEENPNEKWIFQLFTQEGLKNSSNSLNKMLIYYINEVLLIETISLLKTCSFKSGLNSFLTCKAHDSRFSIWKEIFLNLEYCNIEVELKEKRYSLDYLTELNLPFIYEDYKVLKVKYLELVNDEVSQKNLGPELERFLLQKSLWKEKSYLFNQDKKIMNDLLMDLIEIFLIEQNVQKRFSHQVSKIFKSQLIDFKTDEILKEFFLNQSKIISINEILVIFYKYSKVKDFELIFETLPDWPNGSSDELISIFERIIEVISPYDEDFLNLNDMKIYSKDLKTFKRQLKSFSRPKNYKKLFFLSKLCKLSNKSLILKICLEWFGRSYDHLFSTEISSGIIASSLCKKNRKFWVFYLTQVIEKNIEMIPTIAEEVRSYDAWKYSGPLIETVLKCTGLKKTLKYIENNKANLETLKILFETENRNLQYLKNFMKSLELRDKFCIMIADKVKILDFQVSFENFSRNCENYMQGFEILNESNENLILVVFSARIRFYLDQFIRFCGTDKNLLKDNEEFFMNEMKKVLSARRTLIYELYCLKVLKTSESALILGLEKLCSTIKDDWKVDIRNYSNFSNIYASNLELNEPNLKYFLGQSNYSEKDFSLIQRFFRCSSVPTWKTLVENFSHLINKEKYKVLDYFITNFKELSNLGHFFNILNFARKMIEECSFKYSRAEAKMITIEEFLQTRPHLKEIFREFKESWEKISLENYGEIVFKDLKITDPIGYFLVETECNSLGVQLANCLKYLGMIQNRFLLLNKFVDGKASKILTLEKSEICYISSKNLMKIVTSCSNNCLDYGKGWEVAYDWQRINFYIKKFIRKSKFLDIENISTVQYQFELLHPRSKHSRIISEIRQRLDQETLTEMELEFINIQMSSKSSGNEKIISQSWKTVHGLLEKTLPRVRHCHSTHCYLIEFISGFDEKLADEFRSFFCFNKIYVSKFIHLYEYAEIQVFHLMSGLIDDHYKLKFESFNDDEDFLRYSWNLFEKGDIKFAQKVLSECKNVLKRVVVRVLLADPIPDFSLEEIYKGEDYLGSFCRDLIQEGAFRLPRVYNLQNAIQQVLKLHL